MQCRKKTKKIHLSRGMEKVYKQTDDNTGRNRGVKPIEAVGQEFDPNLHNAVMHVEDEESR